MIHASLRHTAVACWLLCLTGCSVLPERPRPMTLLTLEVPATAAPAPQSGLVLAIEPVEAVAFLQGTDFFYRRGGLTVHRYARHRWLAPPAELIDRALMERLDRLPFTGVRPGQGVTPALGLTLTLLRLEQVFAAGSSVVHLELLAQLVDRRQGRVLGTRLFRYRQPAPEASPRGGARAAATALGRFFTDLGDWLKAAKPF